LRSAKSRGVPLPGRSFRSRKEAASPHGVLTIVAGTYPAWQSHFRALEDIRKHGTPMAKKCPSNTVSATFGLAISGERGPPGFLLSDPRPLDSTADGMEVA